MAKACLIRPDSGVDPDLIARWAEIATNPTPGAWDIGWDEVIKGLSDYRRGEYALAIERLTDNQGFTESPVNGINWIHRDAQIQMVLAMAHQGLHHSEEARTAFARGAAILQLRLPQLGSRDLGKSWWDLIIAHVLMDEAEALLADGSNGEGTRMLEDLVSREVSALAALPTPLTNDSPVVQHELVPPTSEWKWLHLSNGTDPQENEPGFHNAFFTTDYSDTHWEKAKDGGKTGAFLGVLLDDEAGGSRIRQTIVNGPAARGGLLAGDLIRLLDGSPVAGRQALLDLLAAKKPGDKAVLSVERGDDTKALTVTLEGLQRPGGFGYGDDNWFAGVDIGLPEVFDKAGKRNGKSAYFRHRFTTTEEHTNLELRCQRDDGIIVYLDGKEVARDNMSEGEEAYELAAAGAVGGGAETTTYRIPLPSVTLEPGPHLLAISLHNTAEPSSDLRIGGDLAGGGRHRGRRRRCGNHRRHEMNDVTQLLDAAGGGDSQAASELLSLVYGELRRVAVAKMARESPGQTLQPTALVHEAWRRLTGDEERQWNDRTHFFAAAAEAMRRILVDNARRKRAKKNGGELQRVEVLESVSPLEPDDDRILAVNEALEKLATRDQPKAELVKLRYLVGLTTAEAAEALGISVPTANRHWAYARAWLAREIREAE